MRISKFYDALQLTEELALENYNDRNGVVDCNLPGICNHYFPKYDLNGNRDGEVMLSCKVAKSVKGQLRYTFQIDGKRIAKREIDSAMLYRGVFQGHAPGTRYGNG